MSTKNSIINPKLSANYIAAVISLTVLLYISGLWGLVTIYGNQLVGYSKENIAFYIELKDDANEANVFAYQKKLETSAFAKPKSVEYISKEQALKTLEGDELLNKEDVLLFGENLLPNMIRFYLNKTYKGDYNKLENEINSNDFVEHVFFTDASTENISTKLYRLEIILLVLMLFFIFVVITLIKNTLKLVLFANKEAIRTMQIVGATWDYMAQPYIRQSIKNGFAATTIAVFAIWITRFLFESDLETIIKADINLWMTLVSFGMLFVGVLVSWWSTRSSVHKYIGKPVEEWEI